jgi:hypothetical protein
MKTRFTAKLSALVLGWLCVASAQANLIVNGGFENNAVASGSWNYYTASAVDGWEGSNVEIWDTMNGVVAPEGRQHAELNAHPYTGSIFSIYQNFATTLGQAYEVSFFYSARASNDEAFLFQVGQLMAVLDDHQVGSWKRFTGSFVADTAMTSLRFSTLNAATVGNFLDAVSVTAKAAVPESSAWALMVLGLLGLAAKRRNLRLQSR